MAKTDLTRFIIPVELDNTDQNQKMGDKSFKTKDLVFLDSDDEIEDLSNEERIISPTDYAIANGAFQWWQGVSRTGKKGTSSYWLRSASFMYEADVVSRDGSRNFMSVYNSPLGVCPALHLNLSSIISARSASRDFGKIAHIKDTDGKVISQIPDRAHYYQGQTPQSFRAKHFKELFNSLTEDEKKILTDAAKVFVIKGEPVTLVQGETFNIKITYPYDLQLAETLLGGEGNC